LSVCASIEPGHMMRTSRSSGSEPPVVEHSRLFASSGPFPIDRREPSAAPNEVVSNLIATSRTPKSELETGNSQTRKLAVRVALVAPFGLRPKGTTIARALPIGKVLAARGASVRLIIPPWDDPARAGQRWTEDGVEIVHTRLAPGPLKAVVIVRDIGAELRTFAPDVVHAFKPIGYSGAVARRLA